jgi:hypothetical protein
MIKNQALYEYSAFIIGFLYKREPSSIDINKKIIRVLADASAYPEHGILTTFDI